MSNLAKCRLEEVVDRRVEIIEATVALGRFRELSSSVASAGAGEEGSR